MKEVLEIFQAQIFECKICNNNKKKIKFMNPYIDFNKKVMNEGAGSSLNRRKFIEDYISKKSKIDIIILGLAPGLNGCGFSGIPFTAEKNAIMELKFPNYHNSKLPYQEEGSANFIYRVIKEVANIKGRTIQDISNSIYMINSCQCVPLKESEKSIKDPSAEMLKNCWGHVSEIIEIIKPKVILVLGSMAYENIISQLTKVPKKNIKKLLQCVLDGTTYQVNNIKIIPDIHPSPQNLNNPNSKDLYYNLEKRLSKYISNIIK